MIVGEHRLKIAICYPGLGIPFACTSTDTGTDSLHNIMLLCKIQTVWYELSGRLSDPPTTVEIGISY